MIMERHVPVSYDLDGEIRNHATKRALHEHGLHDVHVLTLGISILVLLRTGDELGFVEVMAAQGWDYEKVAESSHPESPAYWVRHPSPFTGKDGLIPEGRVFPPDSPCPTDVEHVRHQNGCLFLRVRYSSQPRWRALREHEGDGHEYGWHTLNSSQHDGSPMVEIFLPNEDRRQPVEDLRNPAWRAVEAVATSDRLNSAITSFDIVNLIYDAVVAALKAVEG
jgi:hypothetical protein